jgi:hypothetical protein
MQEVSSFSLGPIVGEGLCLVNAAFSKCITVAHLSGGCFDPKRKYLWRSNSQRSVELGGNDTLMVDGTKYPREEWLRDNEQLWLPEWQKWSRAVAMASRGDFHWCGDSPVVTYRHHERYLDFVTWKMECYVRPSYQLLPHAKVFQFLQDLWQEKRIPLALVHPKGRSDYAEQPLTRELLRELLYSPDEMCCQPYVVAACLMGVVIE